MDSWYCYIVRCSDDSLYTGISNDVEARINAHNAGKGAKYTRSRRPVSLVFYQEFKNKSEAAKKECEIKKFTKDEKEVLVKIFVATQYQKQNSLIYKEEENLEKAENEYKREKVLHLQQMDQLVAFVKENVSVTQALKLINDEKDVYKKSILLIGWGHILQYHQDV